MDQRPFEAPLVDSLEVCVVVDSRYDLFIEDAAHPLLKIEHTKRIPGRERSTLAGEWGLSLHLESTRGGERARSARFRLHARGAAAQFRIACSRSGPARRADLKPRAS